ncbi:porcupine [Anaeramoeba flamelloides]|uniref:Porcupine n=1 Tax=Anaeramoeba flamelloides TaxID=1746091 RepID=A0ABQ8YI66_9EUKA|nr:porcupine [Anaeramoeba flamelloides]
MLLTMKVTKFAWDVYDYRLKGPEQAKFIQKNMISKVPTLFEYLSYILHYNTVLVGPPAGLKRYFDHLEGKLITNAGREKGDVEKIYTNKKRNKIAYGYLIKCTVCLILFTVGNKRFKDDFLVSDFIMSKPLIIRIFLVRFAGILIRFKYYFAMLITFGSNIITGLTFNGVTEDGEYKWDALSMVHPLKVELSQSAFELSKNWNIQTGQWLHEYVYLRLMNSKTKSLNNRNVATAITFFTSAIFHGFYPGYYLCFTLATIVVLAGRLIRKHIRPMFIDQKTNKPIMPAKKYYDWVCYCVMFPTMDSVGLPLVLMSYARNKIFFKNFVYLPFFGGLLTILILSRFKNKNKKMIQKPKEITSKNTIKKHQ